MRVICHLTAGMARLIFLQKLAAEVVYELVNLFLLPFVFALVIVDRILHAFEQLADRLGLAEDLPHRTPPATICSSRPSVSFSRARISARISFRERSGCGL